LVYTSTRKEAEDYAALLGVLPYHGGLTRAERGQAQRAFERGATVVATSAFGMGIDRPDVRFVVHASVPGSLDENYQGIGPGGAAAGTARLPPRSAATGQKTSGCIVTSPPPCRTRATWRPWRAPRTARSAGASSRTARTCRPCGSPSCSTCWRRSAPSGSAARS